MRRNRTRFVLFSLRAIQFLAHEVGKQRGSVELGKTKHRFHRVERFQLINRVCATLGIEKESGCKSCVRIATYQDILARSHNAIGLVSTTGILATISKTLPSR